MAKAKTKEGIAAKLRRKGMSKKAAAAFAAQAVKRVKKKKR